MEIQVNQLCITNHSQPCAIPVLRADDGCQNKSGKVKFFKEEEN
jgi:hypothetical protein